jgi:hypothetical protein
LFTFVDNAKYRRQVFRDLSKVAERYLQGQIPVVKAKLLDGKKGLIVGIANVDSIAWGCAKAFRAFGAELAVTYLNDKTKKYVEPLAQVLNAPIRPRDSGELHRHCLRRRLPIHEPSHRDYLNRRTCLADLPPARFESFMLAAGVPALAGSRCTSDV